MDPFQPSIALQGFLSCSDDSRYVVVDCSLEEVRDPWIRSKKTPRQSWRSL